VPVPYFANGKQVVTDAMSPTRHIIAGIFKSLGNLADPSEGYSANERRVEHNYLWTLGCLPFGHFTTSANVSQIFVDSAVRNTILSRVSLSFAQVGEAMSRVDSFARDYLHNPFEEGVEHHGNSTWRNWIERIYHDPVPGVSVIATTTLYQLHKELVDLSRQFEDIARLVKSHKLEEAYKLSASLERRASAFKDYVGTELEEAESALLCCYLATDVKVESSWWSSLAYVALGLGLFLAIAITLNRFSSRRAAAPRVRQASRPRYATDVTL
jgi:hypothetical protein